MSTRLSAAVALAAALSSPPAAPAGGQPLAARLADRLGTAPTRIEPAPLPGWRLAIFGTQVFLVSEDGRWLVDGAVLSLVSGEDLLEARRRSLRLEALEGFGEANMIVYPARGEARYRLTVFTDVDCPYCRRFHREVPALNTRGVTVRYVPFSLAPPGTPGHRRMVSVWCAEDRRRALDAAKAGRPVPERHCDHPVDAGRRLGRSLGIDATPTLVTGAGRILRGYVPVEQLVALLARERAEAEAGAARRAGGPRR